MRLNYFIMHCIKLRSFLLVGFFLTLWLHSCNTTAVQPKLVWGMEVQQIQQYLQQRNLNEIINYLNENNTEQAMQEALLLGEDSLYTIALIFAEEKEWQLYRRAMMVQAYSGSDYGKKIALKYMEAHKIFSVDEHLDTLGKYLAEQPEKNQDNAQLVRSAILALQKGLIEQSENYWVQFLNNNKNGELNLEHSILGLKLALLGRERAKANDYMRKVVLNFATTAQHKKLQEDLNIRPEWKTLLDSSQDGPFLLQSLAWKVALLQEQFSATLPVLFANGKQLNGKEILSDDLRFWWSQHILIEDTGRAIFIANNYRSQATNVKNGRQRLQSLLDGQTSLNFTPKAHNHLVYWSIRNKRNFSNMEKYRSQFINDNSLRPWLLTEYLYFFKNADHWADFPDFLRSWYSEQPKVNLNNSNIRLFRQIYRSMFLRKKTALLEQIFEEALQWGHEDLILESAWNYRLAKGKPLSHNEWQKIPASIRKRVLSDVRLFVLRADHGEPLLPELSKSEPQKPLSPLQEELHALLSMLVENGFNNEALRLTRLYHKELAASSIVDFSRKIQLQGVYDLSMRMAAQLTYDDNYNMSREALELFYPKAFWELMSNFTQKYNLPRSIFYGLVRQESYFAPTVVSHAGAVGLSQLMPATMNEVAQKIGYRNPDAKDPRTNLKIGSYYLRYLIDHRWTKNFAQALMAYNAGLGNIRKWKARLGSLNGLNFNNSIPVLETRLYVQKISAAAIYYSVLYGWNDAITVLNTIYPDSFPPQLTKNLTKTKKQLRIITINEYNS